MSLENKSLFRKACLSRRREKSQEWILVNSEFITNRFLQAPIIKKLKDKKLSVGVYQALPGEFNFSFFGSQTANSPWELHYPRIILSDLKKMEFAAVPFGSPQSSWQTGAFSEIQEPATHLPVVDPQKLDLIFVPGLAFGERGERLGMGAGHFDRFLPQSPRALRVVLGFDFQIFPSLEQDVWDQPVHWVFTETHDHQMPFVEQWSKQWEN